MEFQHEDLFLNSMGKHHRTVLKNLQAGYFDPPPAGVPHHFQLGTPERPHYITTRSTSQLESAHRWLRHLVTHGVEPLYGHVIIMDAILRWNMKKRLLFMAGKQNTMPLLSFEPDLLNKVHANLFAHLGTVPEDHPLKEWKPIPEIPPTHPDRINTGVMFHDVSSVSSLAFNRFVEQHDDRAEFVSRLDTLLAKARETEINWRGQANFLPISSRPVKTPEERKLILHLARKNRQAHHSGRDYENAQDFVDAHDCTEIAQRYCDLVFEAIPSGDEPPTPIVVEVWDRAEQVYVMQEVDASKLKAKERHHIEQFLLAYGEGIIVNRTLGNSASERQQAREQRDADRVGRSIQPSSEVPPPPTVYLPPTSEPLRTRPPRCIPTFRDTRSLSLFVVCVFVLSPT